jgi:hypothetical protein
MDSKCKGISNENNEEQGEITMQSKRKSETTKMMMRFCN